MRGDVPPPVRRVLYRLLSRCCAHSLFLSLFFFSFSLYFLVFVTRGAKLLGTVCMFVRGKASLPALVCTQTKNLSGSSFFSKL